MKPTKTDFLVIIFLALVTVFFMINKGGGEKRLILLEGDKRTEIPMKKQIMKLDKGTTIIEVTENGARFIENNCPNHTCIKSGWIEKCGETAVCVTKKNSSGDRVQ